MENHFSRNRNFYILVLAAVISTLPLYFKTPAIVDVLMHGTFTKHFFSLLQEGEIYPRYAYEAFYGYGSYIYFIYPPISLYISSLFAWFATDHELYFQALRLSITLAVIVSAFTSYSWLKSKYGPSAALIGALFYISFPSLTTAINLTVSMGMIWCFAWYPVAMSGAERIINGRRKGIFIYALGLALIVLTNIPASLIFIPFAGLYILLMKPNIRTVFKLILSGLLALGLAAIYVIPQLSVLEYINSEILWKVGDKDFYELTLIGIEFLKFGLANNYKDILLTVIVFVIFIIQLIYFLQARRRTIKTREFTVAFGLSIAALVLCSSLSEELWAAFPILQKVQYGARFFILVQVFVTMLAVQTISLKPALAKQLLLFFVLPQFIFAICLFITAPPAGDMERAVFAKSTMAPDFTIKSGWINKLRANDFNSPPVEKFIVISGEASASMQMWKSRHAEFKLTAGRNTVIEIGRSYIPGWRAEIEGREIPLSKDEESGLMQLSIDEAVKDKKLVIELPLLWHEQLGGAVSLFSLAILLFGLLRRKNPAQN